MHIQVITPQELTQEHIDLWRSFQLTDPGLANPYFSPEFTLAVGHVRSDSSVALCYQNEELVAFFPFHRKGFGVGKPIGTALSDYHGIISKAGFKCDPVELIRGCGLKIFDFNHLLKSQASFQSYSNFECLSPCINLTNGYDNYLEECKKTGGSQVKNALRKFRKLERELGPVNFVFHDENPEVFETLLEWKTHQYERTGAPKVFDHVWTTQLLQHILKQQTEQFAGVLSSLYVGDQLIAVHMGMRSQKVWHYWFPTYDFSESVAKYSPGLILLLKMAEHAQSEGIDIIDLGRGDERYKPAFSNDAIELIEGSVTTPSMPGFIRGVQKFTEKTFESLPLGKISKLPRRVNNRIERYFYFK